MRYNDKQNNVSDDKNAETFRTDAWWKKPKKEQQRHAEVRAGGEKALNHELPEVMNANPVIDEETESMMQEFFYGNHDENDIEIE